ncbi:hypothetical protein D3C87_2060620 [compost metagenome]
MLFISGHSTSSATSVPALSSGRIMTSASSVLAMFILTKSMITCSELAVIAGSMSNGLPLHASVISSRTR